MQKTIFIKKIFLPKKSLFQEFIIDLMDRVDGLTGRKNAPSTRTKQKRVLAATLVIEGLYRCFCSQSRGIALAVPHHPNAYKAGDENKINEIGYKILISVVDAMEAMGWLDRKMGRRTGDDVGDTTELRPSGALLEAFKRVGVAWQEILPISDVIHLRNYGEDKSLEAETSSEYSRKKQKLKYRQKPPDSDSTRKMESNLKGINKNFCKQCICLYVSNESFKTLGMQMTLGLKKSLYGFARGEQYPRYLDLSMIQLRRIFSRDSMQMGGRFYGGWWQFMPKKYRIHITINFQATIEVDYSGLHPLMMYHLEGLTPPDGDMYDIGIWKTAKEREQKRPIVKEFFNAIVNDEYGQYRMTKKSKDILGLSNTQLRAKIAETHPKIAHRFNSGYGLTLQYEDSKIAERVMLLLLKEDVTCLPVHDSFIVQHSDRAKLIAAMNLAYKERFGVEISHKAAFLYEVDESQQPIHEREFAFPTVAHKPGDEFVHLDRDALFTMHQESIHYQYCRSWRPKRQNLPISVKLSSRG